MTVTPVNLSVRLLKTEKEEYPYELLLLADPSLEMINKYLENGLCYVAFRDFELIGVYVLSETQPKTYEIVNIAVKENNQGKGIGKRLVLDAVQKAKALGAKTVEIGTGNSSLLQLGLYQKCGFRIIGVERDFFIKHYNHDIIENGIHCKDMIRLSMDL